MRHLRMLEEHKAWQRETGFDRIEIIAKIREQHFLACFDSEPLYLNLYNPRWPHTPEEHTLKMWVDVERLRMEIVFRSPCRRCNVINRCDGWLRSIRGRKNPHCRALRLSQRRGKEYFLLKPGSMFFFTSVAQAWTRRVPLFCFKQTSERTTKQ